MGIRKIKVSALPTASSTEGLVVLGLDKSNASVKASMELLRGNIGPQGSQGERGPKGEKGDTGEQGIQGEIGPKGDKGDGLDYSLMTPEEKAAVKGKSAYEVAVESGFEGSQAEWLEALKGAKGDTGERGSQGEQGSSGEIGAQGERGLTGETGAKGDNGTTPVRGTDYWTAADIDSINMASQEYIDQALAATNTTILSLTDKI